MKIINRRASFDYQLLEKFEAGVVLTGAEVKSVKSKRIILDESFVRLSGGEAWLFNAFIPPYPFADNTNYDPYRNRKLLLNKKELLKISSKVLEKKLTIVPVSCYTKGRNIKIEIALARGKKQYEKREAIRKRDLERELKRVIT